MSERDESGRSLTKHIYDAKKGKNVAAAMLRDILKFAAQDAPLSAVIELCEKLREIRLRDLAAETAKPNPKHN